MHRIDTYSIYHKSGLINFYTTYSKCPGNLHKWCFAPRGSAFLWVAPALRNSLEPLVTSHLYKQDITDQFFMQVILMFPMKLCQTALKAISAQAMYNVALRALWTTAAT